MAVGTDTRGRVTAACPKMRRACSPATGHFKAPGSLLHTRAEEILLGQRHQQSIPGLGERQGCCFGDLPSENPSQSMGLPRPPGKAALPPTPALCCPGSLM